MGKRSLPVCVSLHRVLESAQSTINPSFATMDDSPQSDLQRSYDRVADQYVAHIFDELRHKPLDRQLLDRFAESVHGHGPACDMGCGPGQIARYLHERGVDVCGVDVSAGMLECARRLNPEIEFQ